LTPAEEAKMIFNTLHDLGLGMEIISGDRLYEGLTIDGKQAIQEMKDGGDPYWREMEWPAYYISFLLKNQLRGRMQIVERGRKRICFQGEHPWDVRIKATDYRTPWVILTDVRNTDRVFDDGRGFGLIVIFVIVTKDEDGTFRQWHEELKGGSSEYTRRVEREGRRPRMRKKEMFLIKGTAWFFPTLAEFKRGVDEGWLDEDFARTMRNSDRRSRNPKYAIDISRIPERYKVFVHNFNVDPDEFYDELFQDED